MRFLAFIGFIVMMGGMIWPPIWLVVAQLRRYLAARVDWQNLTIALIIGLGLLLVMLVGMLASRALFSRGWFGGMALAVMAYSTLAYGSQFLFSYSVITSAWRFETVIPTELGWLLPVILLAGCLAYLGGSLAAKAWLFALGGESSAAVEPERDDSLFQLRP